MGMVTDDDIVGLGVCAGEGDGDGETGDDELSFPQAIANIKPANTTVRRNDDIRSSSNETSEHDALMTLCDRVCTPPLNLRRHSNIPGRVEREDDGQPTRGHGSCRRSRWIHRHSISQGSRGTWRQMFGLAQSLAAVERMRRAAPAQTIRS